MKRAVSISIGSSKRNKAVEIELLGEKVRIERIGTDGDLEKAAQYYKELDGKVDAFGMGGTDLGLWVDKRWYNLYSTHKIARFVTTTPLADGGGIKNTLEMRMAAFLDAHLGDYIDEKKVFVVSAVDRWGMAKSFLDAGYRCVFGDLMFGLGLPFPLRSERALKAAAAVLMPVVGRLPFEWIYPTGETQEKRTPKWEAYYHFGPVLAGDCHYIKRHLPDRLDGKVIVTNTTTAEDVDAFRRTGARYLVTSTPVVEGRSFGTNMLEAALVAVAGKGRLLTMDEISDLIDRLGLEPQLQELN
ncbi:MAG: quinate 5-dehydrogenase [Chloroflexota bacterium]